MRKVIHPIAIVTSQSPKGVLRGLLVSSFNTVSLHQSTNPIVSFNIKRPSSTYDAIAASGAFDLSIPWSVDLARDFAAGTYPGKPGDSLKNGRVFGFRCRWMEDKSVTIADHVIIVGQVDGYLIRTEAEQDKEPLAYCNGRYIKNSTTGNG